MKDDLFGSSFLFVLKLRKREGRGRGESEAGNGDRLPDENHGRFFSAGANWQTKVKMPFPKTDLIGHFLTKKTYIDMPYILI